MDYNNRSSCAGSSRPSSENIGAGDVKERKMALPDTFDKLKELLTQDQFELLLDEEKKEEKQKKESLFPRYPRRLQNPFFSDDLRLAAQRYSRGSFSRNGSLCEKYIAGIGSTDANRRIDLIDSSDNKQRAVFEEAFNPLRYPLGKWPSKYSLATMQQFAVNMYSEELYPGREWEYCPEDLMSVNGPPGTGKTTLHCICGCAESCHHG